MKRPPLANVPVVPLFRTPNFQMNLAAYKSKTTAKFKQEALPPSVPAPPSLPSTFCRQTQGQRLLYCYIHVSWPEKCNPFP